MDISFMVLLKCLISGISTGFAICIPLGPSGLESIKRTVNYGFLNGFKVSLGAISADMSYLLIIHLGLANLLTATRQRECLFWIISGSILILLNVFNGKKRDKPSMFNTDNFPPFLSGFLMTFINPMSLSLWLILSGTIVQFWHDTGIIYYFLFIISILITMTAWFAVLNFLAAKGFKSLSSKTNGKSDLTSKILKYILIILGSGFILFGLIKLML